MSLQGEILADPVSEKYKTIQNKTKQNKASTLFCFVIFCYVLVVTHTEYSKQVNCLFLSMVKVLIGEVMVFFLRHV